MRRKEVGKKIKIARRRARYNSQEAFAAAIGKHETSVGNAERGSDRVGEGVYNAIEDALGWPANSILDYIEGRTDEIPPSAPGSVDVGPRKPVLTDAEIAAMPRVEVRKHYFFLEKEYGEEEADDWLVHAASVRRDARRAARTLSTDGV